MLDVSLVEFVGLQLLVLLVSMVVGIVTFGFAMTTTPFLLLFLDARLVVEINLVLTSVLFSLVSSRSWRHVRVHTLLGLILGGVLGIPTGVLLLTSVSEGVLRLILTSIVILTVLMAMWGSVHQFRKEAFVAVPIGALFTFLNASLSLGGPVVAFYAVNQQWSKDQTRAMLSSFFCVTGVAILASHASVGLLGKDELKSAALFVPVLVAGTLIAAKFVDRIDERFFRRLVMIALLGTSCSVLVKELIRIL